LRKVAGGRRRGFTAVICAAALLAVVAAGCGRDSSAAALDRLRACASDQGPADAFCGTLQVFEDRQSRTGRRIDLNIIVLPALDSEAQPDPLFILAGGPGQGAAQMARDVRATFRRIERERDIVLVDQRGTGKSHPLNCEADTDTLQGISESDDEALTRLRGCLSGYDADVRLYTTPFAMDDLDDVRSYLGYERINLYGGSYGTRAALVYMRRHGAHVRAAVLDGAAPTNMRLPLYVARDAERALDKLLDDCAADATCHATFPRLQPRLRALLDRLAASPRRLRLVHPRTGVAEEVEINARFVASVLFGALYAPITSSVLPTMVDRAEHDDFQGLVALAFLSDASQNMSTGMQLSVICSEDAPRISATDAAGATHATLFGASLLAGQLRACGAWPRGTIDPSYYEPVQSDVPTLVLSGDLDPITPPSWGEAVVQHLKNGRHLIAPATGHGVIGSACGPGLIGEFIDRGNASGLSTRCLAALRRPPFFVSPAGPDPAPASRPRPER
jgi:pimeloyl-ACP methyl ester carboxylesterase